jgi:hypothetical protein
MRAISTRKLATVGSEAGTERCEPEVFAFGRVFEGMLQCGEDAWTADVAVLA